MSILVAGYSTDRQSFGPDPLRPPEPPKPAGRERASGRRAPPIRLDGPRRSTGEPDPSPPTEGTGCATCHGTGYRRRTGIFEVLEVLDDVRDLVKSWAAARDYREAAPKSGLVPLREAGIARALMGKTSVAEVMRVT